MAQFSILINLVFRVFSEIFTSHFCAQIATLLPIKNRLFFFPEDPLYFIQVIFSSYYVLYYQYLSKSFPLVNSSNFTFIMKIFSNSLVKVTFFLSQLYFLVWTHISSFKKLHLWGIAFFWLKSYRKIIAVHSFVVFRHTSARISHRYIHIPSFPDLPPISLPTPPFSLSQSPCLSSLSYRANSHWLSVLHMVL